MKPDKKPRSDATLKTLPAARQQEIEDYALAHSIKATVAWLLADGVETSDGAVSGWLSSRRLSAQLNRNASVVETLLQNLAATRPDFTPEQLHLAGQAFFSAMAVEQQNPDIWTATQRLQLDRDSAKTRAEFEREKIELRKQAEARSQEKLEFEKQKHRRDTIERMVKDWLAAKESQAILNSSAGNAEKIEKLGALMFGEDWN